MNEPEAKRRAAPRVRRLVLATVVIWVGTIWLTWAITRGDYHRTFPSAWWFWGIAFVASWTIGAYYSLNEHIDGPELEEVKLSDLRFAKQKQKPVLTARPAPTMEELDGRWHAVLGAYGAFLSDIVQIADMPLLADPTCPPTEKFQEQLVLTEDARSDAVRNPRKTPQYEAAVKRLEKDWEAARGHAKRKGFSTLDDAEQDAIRRAQSLLDIALDENAFAPERRAAMHKAVALLRTVVDLPDTAVSAIDHRVTRLELEDH